MANNKEKKVLNVPNSKDRGNVIRNVPALRFPEFTDEWKKIRLDSFTERVMRKNKNNLSKLPLTISAQYGLVDQITFFNKVVASTDMSNYYLLKKGEFAYNKSYSSDYPWGAIKRLDNYEQGALSSLYICFAPKDNVETDFILQYFESPKWHKGVSEIAVEGARNHGLLNISVQDFFHTHHYMPKDKKEQAKIAKLLMFLDERIATQNKIIERYESLIRGIMVELQKQGLKRGTWKKVFLNDILKERNERNSNLYQVFSVSVSQGIINQVDHLGRSFSAKDTSKYNVVHYGDLVYTKSPTGSFPYGIVKQSLNRESVAVSPLYGVYVPDSLAIGIYLHKYFMSEINTQNYLHPLIQKGAKNTINITNQRFLENRVPMPLDSNELVLISKLLRSLNNKIRHEQNILQEYQKQKQYLLRQMFI